MHIWSEHSLLVRYSTLLVAWDQTLQIPYNKSVCADQYKTIVRLCELNRIIFRFSTRLTPFRGYITMKKFIQNMRL